jgi:hypothetical protein
MNEMPYRHVAMPADRATGTDVRALCDALANEDVPATLAAAQRVRAAAGSATGDADALAAIEQLVRAVSANRTALLPLRSVAPELTRAVKSPWRTHGVAVTPAAVLAELPATEVRSVRLDSTLTLTITTDGVLGRPRFEDGALLFSHARKPTARVEGPPDRLALLASVVGSARLMPDDLRSAKLPLSLGALAARVAARQREIDDLLLKGRALVESVERLVCRLYDLPDSLTDLVVQSAVSRAGTIAQAND